MSMLTMSINGSVDHAYHIEAVSYVWQYCSVFRTCPLSSISLGLWQCRPCHVYHISGSVDHVYHISGSVDHVYIISLAVTTMSIISLTVSTMSIISLTISIMSIISLAVSTMSINPGSTLSVWRTLTVVTSFSCYRSESWTWTGMEAVGSSNPRPPSCILSLPLNLFFLLF